MTAPAQHHEALAQATALAKSGDFDGAMVALKGLLAAEPQHELALGMLAAIYAQLHMHDRAAEYFRRVLEIDSQNPLARFHLGLSELQANRPAEALDAWRPMQADESDFLIKYFSGVALLALDRAAEARASFDFAQNQMPKNHALYPQLLEILATLDRATEMDSSGMRTK